MCCPTCQITCLSLTPREHSLGRRNVPSRHYQPAGSPTRPMRWVAKEGGPAPRVRAKARAPTPPARGAHRTHRASSGCGRVWSCEERGPAPSSPVKKSTTSTHLPGVKAVQGHHYANRSPGQLKPARRGVPIPHQGPLPLPAHTHPHHLHSSTPATCFQILHCTNSQHEGKSLFSIKNQPNTSLHQVSLMDGHETASKSS